MTRALLVAVVLLLASPTAAAAATVDVTTTADHNDKVCDKTDCTLREAVELGANTINLPKGRYVLTLGELVLVNDHIVGAGARAAIIDAKGGSRVLRAGDGCSTIDGVTVTGGNGDSTVSPGAGGGIFVQSGAVLTITNSTIAGNTATTGGGIAAAGTLGLSASTVSGNTASGGRLVQGGGITVTGTGGAAIVDSTISGNTAAVLDAGTSQGGGIASAGGLSLNGVTIADNTAASAAGLFESVLAGVPPPARTIANTIIGANKGSSECGGNGLATDTTHNDLDDDGTCALADATDHRDDPQLGPLANNGGPTNTHALLAPSPAINQGSGCGPTDQRGVARPQPPGSVCDIGAYEYRAPTLTVNTTVVNDAGGTAAPGDFTVHVRNGAGDVKGSPQPGSDEGTTYTLDAGSTYVVGADAVGGYVQAITGGCGTDGSITLAEGQVAACTIAADDVAPTLDVVTTVVNDDGGTRKPSDLVVHVRDGLVDVTGSPQLGDPGGRTYSLVGQHSYTVAAGALPGYTITVGGSCAAAGTVHLDVGDAKKCTVTANDVAATLKVVTTVINDNGGTKTPAAFSVHVRKGAADVAGSPKPGSASGTTYKLDAGTYAIGADAATGYAATITGACAANGSVSLQVGQAKTCTVTENDKKPVSSPLPPPKPGKNVNALPGPKGTVTIKLPGSDEFVPLVDGEQLPLGTVVNAKKGRVTIVPLPGSTAAADFYGGIFKLGQTKGKKPITVLTLVEKLSCKGSGKLATTAKKKRRKRRLWGDGKGRFRTSGSFSSATVRGTKWMVQDTCTTTLTRVARGKVAVRDFVKKKTVLVKAGHKYVARKR